MWENYLMERPSELLAQERTLHFEADVGKLLDGKTFKELGDLQWRIKAQLDETKSAKDEDIWEAIRDGKTLKEIGDFRRRFKPQLDTKSTKEVEYWEAILKVLKIYKAKVFACDDLELLDFENRRLCFTCIFTEDYRDVQQTRLNLIHKYRLRRHLECFEKLSKGVHIVEENEEQRNGMNLSDAGEAFSTEPMVEEEEAAVAAEEARSFSPKLMQGDDREEAIDPEEDKKLLEMKRMAVLEKHKRRLREDMASKPAPVKDNLELKVVGAVEQGDAVFGSNAELNHDS